VSSAGRWIWAWGGGGRLMLLPWVRCRRHG
jgi:hypothetical protein